MSDEKQANDKKAKQLVRARALADFTSDGERKHKCNDIVELEEGAMKAAKAAGHVDDSPAAIAYVEKRRARAKVLAEAQDAG